MPPIIRQAVGWSLLGLGLIGMLVPVLPGTLFLAMGALLLAPYVRPFRRIAAWFHKRFPTLRGPMRRFRDFKVRHARYTTIHANSMSLENHLAKSATPPQSDACEKPSDTIKSR